MTIEEALETLRTETDYAFIFIIYKGEIIIKSNCDKLVHMQIAKEILENIIKDEIRSSDNIIQTSLKGSIN